MKPFSMLIPNLDSLVDMLDIRFALLHRDIDGFIQAGSQSINKTIIFPRWKWNINVRKYSMDMKTSFLSSRSASKYSTKWIKLEIKWYLTVLQRRLKMDRRWIRRFFGFWKWTEDEYEESSLIQKFFEDCNFFEYLWSRRT